MRKSRRWLLTSMGASAFGAIATADPVSDQSGSPATTVVNCEQKTTPVSLGSTPVVMPSAPADSVDALYKVFGLGLHFQCQQEQTGSLDSTTLKPLLDKAYGDAIKNGELDPSLWILAVLQAHILGQLTQYFWRKRKKPTDKLKPSHLLAAWNHFHRATSTPTCAEYICHDSLPGNLRAYALPSVTMDKKIHTFQIDQPCSLC